MDEIKRLMKQGFNQNLAIMLSWNNLTEDEKNKLTFERTLSLWKSVYTGYQNEKEFWILLKRKTLMFHQFEILLLNTSPFSVKREEVLKLIREKASKTIK
jgi:hypothetical protein